MESQNTYLDTSPHTTTFRLQMNDASIKPVPQQPLLTSSKSETQKEKEKKTLILMGNIIAWLWTCSNMLLP